MTPFVGRHGVDNTFGAGDGLFRIIVIDVLSGFSELGGQFVQQAGEAVHVFHLCQLIFKVIEIKAVA